MEERSSPLQIDEVSSLVTSTVEKLAQYAGTTQDRAGQAIPLFFPNGIGELRIQFTSPDGAVTQVEVVGSRERSVRNHRPPSPDATAHPMDYVSLSSETATEKFYFPQDMVLNGPGMYAAAGGSSQMWIHVTKLGGSLPATVDVDYPLECDENPHSVTIQMVP